MPQATPDPVEDSAEAPVVEGTAVNYKKIVLILLAAIVCGLGVGVAGALALREYAAPPVAPTAEPASATAVPAAPAPTPASAPAPAPAAALAPAPAEAAPTSPPEQITVSTATAGSKSIPVLTGAEIKERYNITRFVDVETDQLCYLAEPRSSGMNGSLSCGQRPSHVSRSKGE